ncbi:AlpA family transcriptional regulator [Dyella jiangningensis]|uniref:helix-turn-helix transcriptional regulator n=1 Tax=Dyella jiangningensis TaxID=1379159 RepID=UPI00240F8351|nr:AlpA family transcriptional regulator [Dyella jiangningensis]MDG2539838.1 AlpA family transcriptional regulator [Dyella jiangningensis]
MSNRFLRLTEVRSRTGLARSTIYAKVKLGVFPKPVKLGPLVAVWIEAEIEGWLEARIAERDMPSNAASGRCPLQDHRPTP